MAASPAITQIKTPRGFVPFKTVELETNGSGSYRDHALSYALYDPIELSALDRIPEPKHDERHSNLIGLASCLADSTSDDRLFDPHEGNILSFARNSGPLFGQSDTEAIRDWANAAQPALFAIRAQQSLNTEKGFGPIAVLMKGDKRILKKERIEREDNGRHLFDEYQLVFFATGNYRPVFKGLPIARIIRTETGFYYAFASSADTDTGLTKISIRIFHFTDELTSGDFNVLQKCQVLDKELVESAQNNLRLSTKDGGILDPDTDIQPTVIDKLEAAADRDALTAMVQMLVITHLMTARVDVFQGNQETGFLSFESYLSWLWFDFANKLSTVKIGYCDECGRAFSLAGHRGPARRFCSEECKNANRNARSRKSVNDYRNDFLNNGKSVQEIARDLYESSEDGKKSLSEFAKQVREKLESWPKLKQEIENEIREKGMENSRLFIRCKEEGLDLIKLLNKQRKEELKARAPR